MELGRGVWRCGDREDREYESDRVNGDDIQKDQENAEMGAGMEGRVEGHGTYNVNRIWAASPNRKIKTLTDFL